MVERDNRSITILPAFLDVLQGLAQQINHIRIAMRWVRNGSWTFDDDVEHADKFKLAALFGVLQQYRVAAYLSFRFTSESKRKFILRGAELCNIHLRRQGPEFWCRPMNAEKLAILNIFQEDAKLNKLADEGKFIHTCKQQRLTYLQLTPRTCSTLAMWTSCR